ncbi:MAG TPA: FlgD immunoglobulin-like domain containing protein [Spirochaetia bacterium]|nr:FlgD immunoglobulin-like domain containing protein [Spirochaetia bacterium]
MRKSFVLWVSLFLQAAAFTFGQATLDGLSSPYMLGTGPGVSAILPGSGEALNPAISGAIQRATLDASYFALIGSTSSPGSGSFANLGAAFPFPFGVISAGGRFVSSTIPGYNYGTLGGARLSFSKDLFPTFLIGVGLQSYFGEDYGVWGDVGVLYRPGDLGFFKDTAFGLSFDGLGRAYRYADGSTGPGVTPRFSADAALVATRPVRLATTLSLSSPGLADLDAGLGIGITLFDTVRLSGSYTFNLKASQNGTARTYPFGFGLDFHLNLAGAGKPAPAPDAVASGAPGSVATLGDASAWRQSEIDVRTAAAPLSDGVWAAGGGVQVAVGVIDRTPPSIRIDSPDMSYISPNFDGTKDDLVLPISITDQRYVKGYRLVIQDAQGNVVRTIENKESRPENAAVQTVINRLLYVKKGIPVPATLRWDGVSSGGTLVPDGTYSYSLEAWDDNGNLGKTKPRLVVVDTQKPEAKIATPFTIFGPGGESTRSTLQIEQQGSSEDLWTGVILDAGGKTVRTYSWKNAAPATFSWDGKNEKGEVVQNGLYTYRLSSTDRAGNAGTYDIPNITVLTAPTPLGLSVGSTAFSPNGDGVQDTETLKIDAQRAVAVSRWELSVFDSGDQKVRTYTGGSELPAEVVFDGKSSAGAVLPEGNYHGKLAVLYVNGNAPEAQSSAFTLDLTPPSAGVEAEYPIFSPDGDGRKDTVTFFQESSRESAWNGVIRNAAGETVRHVRFIGTVDPRFIWNGTGDDGQRVADGRYTYTLETMDAAGNSGASSPVSVTVDTRPTPVTLSASPVYLSPNGDGVDDSTQIRASVGLDEGIGRYEISIADSAGTNVRTFTGSGAIPGSVTWDGTNTEGRILPDGTYTTRVTVDYLKGNLASAAGPDLVVDTTAPRVSVSTDDPVFSPDGDGLRDTLLIHQTSSSEDSWTAEIKNSGGATIRTWTWNGMAPDLVWDGRDAAGNIVPDGVYQYRISATDRAGNTGSGGIEAIRVDTRPTPVKLKVDTPAFSPDGDGVLDTLHFLPDLKVNSGISNWSLTVFALINQRQPVRTWKGSESVPASIEWDGKTDGGTRADEGSYIATLDVTYAKGNRETARTGELVLDVTKPRASVEATPTIFSPNGDGRKDQVQITQSGSIEPAWVGVIRDGAGKAVRTFNFGRTPDPTIIWDGRDGNGVLLPNGVYSYQLSATDQAGNSGASNVAKMTLDVRATPVGILRNPAAFSPNGDGVLDSVTLLPSAVITSGISSYEIRIEASDGTVVRTFTGATLPASLPWDGRTQGATLAADGTYRAVLSVNYENGNLATATTPGFVLDTRAPTATLSATYRLFSPNGDGRKDVVPITQNTSAEDRWLGEILDAGGQPVRTYEWSGRAPSFAWDGKDNSGNVVPDGVYSYRLSATDSAGNKTSSDIAGITVDTRPTPVFLSTDQTGFSPNGDGNADTITFNTVIGLPDGLSSWKLEIGQPGSSPARTYSGNGPVPQAVTWDGRTDDGSRAPEGSYRATLTLQYDKGSQPSSTTPPFVLNTNGPSVSLSASPVPFSPDNDGVDDELTISTSVRDVSPIQSWNLTIFDPTGLKFNEFSGKGTPTSRIVWDGLSSSGELVQSASDYPMVMTVTDSLGNVTRAKAVASVDVLVVREGDQLKIRIASIVFAPNTANYLDVPAAEKERNLKTINRLAEIFKKYGTYNIRIDGYAVMVNWDNPTEGAAEQKAILIPLSKARADSIKQALVERGIAAGRVTTIGKGGVDPIVPFGDLENRWKDRRVEFVLIK